MGERAAGKERPRRDLPDTGQFLSQHCTDCRTAPGEDVDIEHGTVTKTDLILHLKTTEAACPCAAPSRPGSRAPDSCQPLTRGWEPRPVPHGFTLHMLTPVPPAPQHKVHMTPQGRLKPSLRARKLLRRRSWGHSPRLAALLPVDTSGRSGGRQALGSPRVWTAARLNILM